MQINIPFDKLQIRSGGYGLLDVVFLPNGNAWAVGGGGTIFSSTNAGQNWIKDKAADELPSNLYKIKFFGPSPRASRGPGAWSQPDAACRLGCCASCLR